MLGAKLNESARTFPADISIAQVDPRAFSSVSLLIEVLESSDQRKLKGGASV